MHKPQSQVEDFHHAMNQVVGSSPAIREGYLRASLILEEAIETACALIGQEAADRLALDLLAQMARSGKLKKPDLVEAIDGLCDVLYVIYGTAVTLGVDLEPFFEEVHHTNMMKANGPISETGKRLKPEGWEAPRIADILKVKYGV